MSNDEWETPPDLFALLDAEFNFDLDAAARESNALCDAYITPAYEDALEVSWSDRGARVWCNPPYSTGNLAAFCAKAWAESSVCEVVVLLVPVDTSTKWWQAWVMRAHEVRLIDRRVRFHEGGEPGKSAARFASAVVIWRPGPRPPVFTSMGYR